MPTPAEVFDDLRRSDGAQPRGSDALMVCCPCHEDAKASLSVKLVPPGRLLVKCFAGCDARSILRALNVTNPAGNSPDGEVYVYLGPNGRPLFRVVRRAGKRFSQNAFRDGVWQRNMKGALIVPYRLPEVLGQRDGGTVYVVEGEKDVHTLEAFSLVATTNPGGAGKFRKEFDKYFSNCRVVVLPDNDDPGRQHAEQVAEILHGIAAEVKIVELPRLQPKEDVTDWLQRRRGSIEELRRLVEQTPCWRPLDDPDLIPLGSVVTQEVQWLWDGVIPMEMVTLFSGDPNIGKSYLTLDLAARISTGRPFPGMEAATSGGVLLLSAEDHVACTVVPRLERMEADLDRIACLQGFRERDRKQSRLVSLQRDLARLDQIVRSRTVRLVIIDPITAYLDGADANSNCEIRSILLNLGEFATRNNLAVVVVAHDRKAHAAKAVHRVAGSLAFTAAARSVYSVSRDPTFRSRRLLLPVKVNIARDPVGYAFTVTPEGLVEWESDPVSISPDGNVDGQREGARVAAVCQELTELLTAPTPASVLYQWARDEEVPDALLAEALRRIGAVDCKVEGKAGYRPLTDDERRFMEKEEEESD